MNILLIRQSMKKIKSILIKDKGFTLLEMVISTCLISIILSMIYYSYSTNILYKEKNMFNYYTTKDVQQLHFLINQDKIDIIEEKYFYIKVNDDYYLYYDDKGMNINTISKNYILINEYEFDYQISIFYNGRLKEKYEKINK